MEKTISVDFDGVIHKYSKGRFDGTIYDEPVEGAFEALERMKKTFKVVIFTTRDAESIRAWFKKYGKECDYEIFLKPKAMLYIDDRALRFTNWRDILNYVR